MHFHLYLRFEFPGFFFVLITFSLLPLTKTALKALAALAESAERDRRAVVSSIWVHVLETGDG